MIALIPGTFDPITFGHLDIIYRASGLFEAIVIGVGSNPNKTPLLSPDERVALIKTALDEGGQRLKPGPPRWYAQCRQVYAYSGLTIDFAEKMHANVIVRAIRDFVDLRYEFEQARVNRRLKNIETLFLSPSDSHLATSSTLVREIWKYGQDSSKLADLVPQCVIDKLQTLGSFVVDSM